MIENISLLLFLINVFIITGLIKEYNLFESLIMLISKCKNKKVALFLMSCLSGLLPIPNRTLLSCSLFDTMISNNLTKTEKKHIGVINFLATHHYYWWSPLEKTVAVPMAIFGLSYLSFLSYTWMFIGLTMAFIYFYIFLYLKKDIDICMDIKQSTVKITPILIVILAFIGIFFFNPGIVFSIAMVALLFYCKEYNVKKLLSFVKWKLLLLVSAILCLGMIVKVYDTTLIEFFKVTVKSLNTNDISIFLFISLMAFGVSFVLGSSSKYVLIATFLISLFGMDYFQYFMVIEYIGYILSPTHKCVLYSSKYFETPIKYYYKVLLIFSLLLFTFMLFNFRFI